MAWHQTTSKRKVFPDDTDRATRLRLSWDGKGTEM